MTDDAMKDLVTKHDLAITQLVTSVEHLVKSQTETNKRLEEISKFLAKQSIFSTKLESIDKELTDSFKQVHRRIDEIDTLQKNELGCNSVRLLTKDVESVTKDVLRLIGTIEEHRLNIETLSNKDATRVNPATARWAVGIFILYSVTFGVYVVQSINSISQVNIKLTEIINRDTSDIVKIDKKLDKLLIR